MFSGNKRTFLRRSYGSHKLLYDFIIFFPNTMRELYWIIILIYLSFSINSLYSNCMKNLAAFHSFFFFLEKLLSPSWAQISNITLIFSKALQKLKLEQNFIILKEKK